MSMGRLLLDLLRVAGTAAAGVVVGVLAGADGGFRDEVHVCSRRRSVACVTDVGGA